MPAAVKVCKDFTDWGMPKLRSLHDARHLDARAGEKSNKYRDLHRDYMDEYDNMPFAKGSFHQYLDASGNVVYADAVLRDKAARWLHNHSHPEKLSMLEKFEARGGVSDPSPQRATTASELWAEAEKEHVRQVTCAELNISVDATQLPKAWLGTRKSVVKREFDMLAEDEKTQWEVLAEERKLANRARAACAVAVQKRQEAFHGELSTMLRKRMGQGALGDYVMVCFQGVVIGQADRRLYRFRGQQSSFGAPKFSESPAFDSAYKSWVKFVQPLVEDHIISDFPELPEGTVGAALLQYRLNLRSHLEQTFHMVCRLQEPLDCEQFWAEIQSEPNDFVDPERLPAGTRLKNPELMAEHDLVQIYQHIYKCFWHGDEVEDHKRFVFEEVAVQQWAGLERARLLKAARAAKDARAATIAAPPGPTTPVATELAPACSASAGSTTATPPEHGGQQAGDRPSVQPNVTDPAHTTAPANAGGELAAVSAAKAQPRKTGKRVREPLGPLNEELAAEPSMAQQGYKTRRWAERRLPAASEESATKKLKKG